MKDATMTAEMKASLKKAEEAIELHDLMERVRKVDIRDVSSAAENLLRGLDSFDLVKKRTAPKAKPKGRSGKDHWRARKARAQAMRSRAYVQEKKKRKYEWQRIWEEAKASGDEAKAWYLWLSRESTRMAHKQRKGWEITEEQFREHLFPTLGGKVPVFQRYDKKGKWSLHNVYLTVDGRVVFCGKDLLLKELGYCL